MSDISTWKRRCNEERVLNSITHEIHGCLVRSWDILGDIMRNYNKVFIKDFSNNGRI